MRRNSHTIDQDGFDYMANFGQAEKDRDLVGIILAAASLAFISVCQYAGLL